MVATMGTSAAATTTLAVVNIVIATPMDAAQVVVAIMVAVRGMKVPTGNPGGESRGGHR
jgi:hypothetical protein